MFDNYYYYFHVLVPRFLKDPNLNKEKGVEQLKKLSFFDKLNYSYYLNKFSIFRFTNNMQDTNNL